MYTETRYGRFIVPDGKDLISSSLLKYGEWAQNELEVLSGFIPVGGIALDIGAFVGTHSRAFACMVGEKGKVYAFEPNIKSFNCLQENAKACPEINIKPICTALGRAVASANIIESENQENMGAARLSVGDGNYRDCSVQVNTLDSFGIENVDFVKIDVEGMELDVLAGGKETIQQYRPVIFMEVNSLAESHGGLDWAADNQYRVFGVLTLAFNQNNFRNVADNAFSSATETGFILLPEEKYGQYEGWIVDHGLPSIATIDDIALLLLHKPQYPYEVLCRSDVSRAFGLKYPSPAMPEIREALRQRRNEIADLLKVAERTSSELQQHKKKLENRNAEAITLSGKLDAALNKITELEEGIEVREAERNRLINSMSWKLTGPVRFVGRLWRGEFSHACHGLRSMVSSSLGFDREKLKEYQLVKPYVDVEYYLATYPDVSALGADPVSHYLNYGWKEDRNPSAGFDTRFYISSNPDVRDADMNPLVHYVLYGKQENRLCKQDVIWEIKNEKPGIRDTSVTIILPVYKDVVLTRKCIDSALPGIQSMPGAKLLIVNDASPDQGMREMLDDIVDSNPAIVSLISNEANLGFVRSVNSGLKACPAADVVLLNSDVILPKEWLVTLAAEAYSHESVGTLTPLSNNTTITSFPNFNTDNTTDLWMDLDELAKIFSKRRLPNVAAPTGVGFCMYIKRQCLEQVGYFNEDVFGKGYGEENDFCQRAISKGWLNAISPNMYVIHAGGISFGQQKNELVIAAQKKLHRLHPEYHKNVDRFIKNDPLLPGRIARVVDILQGYKCPKILHITHGLSGGVIRHVQDLCVKYANQAVSVVLSPKIRSCELSVSLRDASTFSFEIAFDNGFEDLYQLLVCLGLSGIHYHHVLNVPDELLQLPEKLNINYLITVHDYYMMNGNPTLTDDRFIFPGNYSNNLINPNYVLDEKIDVRAWQVKYQRFLWAAHRVLFPSAACHRIFSEVYALENTVISYHPEIMGFSSPDSPGFIKKDRYVIGVIGAIGKEKGADYLEDIAHEFKKAGAAVDFRIIGYACRTLKDVESTGSYLEEELDGLLANAGVDILFFPARWPETYSYTLSAALRTPLPIIAPDVGAFPERLCSRENVLLFDYKQSSLHMMELISEFISGLERTGRVDPACVCQNDSPDSSFYEHEYLSVFSVRESCETDLPVFHPAASISTFHLIAGRTGRSRLEGLLFRLSYIYNHPRSGMIRAILPYSYLRPVKQRIVNRFVRTS